MADESDRPKRAKSHMGGDTRATIGKLRRTPPYGVKVEEDWDEITQPPGPPPQPEHLAEMPVEQRIEALHETVRHLQVGVTQVWPARHADDQFGRVQLALQGVMKEQAETGALLREFLVPAVKAMMARLDGLERSSSTEGGRLARFFENDWPRLESALEKIDRRMDLAERQLDRVERSQDSSMKRVEDAHGSMRAEIDALKQERDAAILRISKLEKFEIGIKAKVATVAALIGASGGGAAAVALKALLGG